MQQTEKYKLNLIEPSDPFLPEGLNANTQKVEEVLSEGLDGMDARVTALEGHRFAYGSYVGNGTTQIIQLPFTPTAVLVCYFYGTPPVNTLAVRGSGARGDCVQVVEGGFKVTHTYQFSPNDKSSSPYYNFIAFS